MSETIYRCGLCGRPGTEGTEGWRIEPLKDKPDWLIIRCDTCLTSAAKKVSSRENGAKGGRPSTQKFKTGDAVMLDGEKLTVMGLSPSTQKRRSGGQWRYRLSDGTYADENMLTLQ